MTSIKATLITPDGRRDVTRRFMADADVISCYADLTAKIIQIFPGLTPDNFALYWKGTYTRHTRCNFDVLLTASMEDLYHTELSNKKKKKKKKILCTTKRH